MFFNGQLIFKPGSYSVVDASGLASKGLGANGIVAVLGTAEGGQPAGTMTSKSEFLSVSRPGKEDDLFRSGDLLEAIPFLFEPCNDQDIPGGAQLVIPMKVNPDTQSTATFANAEGDSLVITSADYGDFTNQIQVVIATGTTQGKRIVVTLEDVVQTIDDVGGDDIFTCIYRPASGAGGVGWETMTMEVLSGGQIRANGSWNNLGLDSEVVAGIASDYTAVSANAADTTQTLTVYGLRGGVPTRVQVTLNGTTPVALGAFDVGGPEGAILSAVAAGIVTVSDTAPTAVLTIAAGQVQRGARKMSSFFVNGAITQVADGASVTSVWYVGRNAAGSIVIDRLALNGLTPVVSAVTTLVSLEAIVLGEVAAARTVTISARALQTTAATQNTLQKVADFVNARQVANSPDPFGFELELQTARTTFAVSLLDLTLTPTNIFTPVTGSFRADLNALVEAINNNMDLVTAEAASGAIGVPDNTAPSVFLSGGATIAAQFSDWQAALNLLKLTRVNTIVVLTADPAVHAAVKAHCNFMAGIGRSERDAVVGLMDAAGTALADVDEIRDQILDLNTRHVRAVAQSVERFNKAGELTEFDPPFHACLVAGAQAGSPVGTPLTFKLANVNGFDQDSSWNSVNDAEEMLQLGLMFLEDVEGIGRRWVRNITTNVGSDNIAFTEASVNQAVNFSVFNFRTNMEVSVGKKGFAGTVNAAKSVATNTLGLLVDAEVLTQYRALDIELILDVLEVSVEIAPVIPINFVRNVLHLVTARLAAA